MQLVRQLKLPPEEIWLRRVETSVLAVLGQLRAQRNWHRIMLESMGGEPATELGAAKPNSGPHAGVDGREPANGRAGVLVSNCEGT